MSLSAHFCVSVYPSVLGVCNPSPGEAETGTSVGLAVSQACVNSRPVRRMMAEIDLSPPCAHTQHTQQGRREGVQTCKC